MHHQCKKYLKKYELCGKIKDKKVYKGGLGKTREENLGRKI